MAAAVGVGEGAEGVDVADGVERGAVERGITAGLGEHDVSERAVAFHLKGDVDAVSGGLGVEHLGVPLGGDLLGDILDVEGEAGPKAASVPTLTVPARVWVVLMERLEAVASPVCTTTGAVGVLSIEEMLEGVLAIGVDSPVAVDGMESGVGTS